MINLEKEDISYHHNGAIYYKWPKNRNGVFVWWYDNGNINKKNTIINGLFEKKFLKWNYNGTRWYIKQYKNGIEIGPKIVFNYGAI